MNFPEEYRHDFAIIRETSDQIIKDFGIDLEINFSGNHHLAFEEIKAQILPVISNMIKSDKQAFQALLYRVDVSEKEYKQTFENHSNEFEEKLAEVIIRREFKKVLTRRFFSKK